jgi:hypothetical protein
MYNFTENKKKKILKHNIDYILQEIKINKLYNLHIKEKKKINKYDKNNIIDKICKDEKINKIYIKKYDHTFKLLYDIDNKYTYTDYIEKNEKILILKDLKDLKDDIKIKYRNLKEIEDKIIL